MTQEFPRPEDLNQVGIIGDDGSKGRAVLVDSGGRILLAGNSGVDIGDVDVFSVIPGTGATNLGKAEDAVHVSGDVGVMLLAVRQDAQAGFGDDGDYVPLSIDANGALRVSGGGGGTEYTEDAAAAANPVGNALILVRTDTPATQVTTDGDNIAQRGTNYGAAYVQLVTSAGAYIDSVGGGTQYAVDAALGATPTGTLAVAIRDDALSALTPVEGDAIGLRVDANGALWVIPSGSVAVTGTFWQATQPVSLASVPSHAVTNAGTFAVQVDGAALTALQLIDDVVYVDDTAVHATGTSKGVGVMAAATPTDAAVAANDIGMLAMTTDRKLHVAVMDALAAGDNNIGNVDIVTVPAPLSVVGTGTEAAAMRVTIATDSTGVLSVDDNGGAITVDWAGTAPPIGAGLEATALRVTVASDSTGVLSVDDNAGSLTVDAPVGTPVFVRLSDGAAAIATLPVSLATLPALVAGTAAIGKLAANSGVDIGDVDVTSIAAGANLIGDVSLQPRTTGGLSFYKTIDLDETEEEVKATAGQIYGLIVMNLTAALLYFKVYNATAANVIVGTTVPDLTIPIPGNNDSDGGGFVWSVPQGIAFGTAITIACTTAIADADAGAPGANACVATVLYK